MKRSFLQDLETSLRLAGKAPATVRAYVACVKDFVRYAGVSVSRLGSLHIGCFLAHLTLERGLEPSTVKVYVYAVRFLFEVTLERPEVVSKLKAPRVTPKPVLVLSRDEVVRFLDGFRSVTYRALACLVYGTGMRIGEALSVKVQDIDSARGVINVLHTKVRRPRVARLSPALLEVLRQYWRATRPPQPYLFPGRDPRRPLEQTIVQSAFKSAARSAGLTKVVTPHILRHTFATHLLEAGVDIHTVQLLLGHANLAATLRYLHVSTAHVAGRITPLHPLLGGGRDQ